MKFIPALIAVLFVAFNAQATPLPAAVKQSLKQAHIPLSAVGIVVQETHAHQPIISQNAKQAMNPASTMKLLTTLIGLETLGPAYRWKTEAYLDGKLEDGVLNGNLVFKGYGDPKLTVEQFWLWLHELRQRGLREIRGDVVLDRSFFEAINHDPAEFDNDPTRAYNVGPDALLLNFNALHLRLMPNAGQTSALLEPDLTGYTISNHITTDTQLPCNGGDTYTARLEGRSIVLEGAIPAGCGEAEDYFSLLPHGEYFFAVFSALWKELGGTVQGKLSAGSAPTSQAPFATRLSPPLSEVIRDINKFSNNTMARQLFLTLGTVDGTLCNIERGSPITKSGNPLPAKGWTELTQGNAAGCPMPAASPSRSIAAVQQWLNKQPLQFTELVLENGAGLSRTERISAQHLADILQRAAHSPFSAELEASLPILGMDGTVKKRFKDSEIAGHAHLKTGTLDGVKSIAGYVHAQSGKQWVVVFIINHPNAALGQPAQDALIEWLRKWY